MEYGMIPKYGNQLVIPQKTATFNLLLAADAVAGDVAAVPLNVASAAGEVGDGVYSFVKIAETAGFKTWPCVVIQDGGTKLTDVKCTYQGVVKANVITAGAAAAGVPVYTKDASMKLTVTAGGKMVGHLLEAIAGAEAGGILVDVLFDGGTVGQGLTT